MSEASAARLAAVILDLARAHAGAAPPPRALPYLGLEHPSGTGLHLLDDLAARGIFRKYELVLDLEAGLGGSSRWLAARRGCEVVGTAASAAEAGASRELSRRAGLAAQVRAVAAAPARLPFGDGRFTHVWVLETLPRLGEVTAALAEAFRVVRRGGTIAVQDLVLAHDGSGPRHPGLATVAERRAQLAAAGFVDLEARDRTGDAPERSAQVTAARAQLQRRLTTDAQLAAFAAERETLAAALRDRTLRVAQLLARRP